MEADLHHQEAVNAVSRTPFPSTLVPGVMSWFITGTDTGAGKTLVSQALLRALVHSGRRAVGMKPVASGCEPTPAGLRSADALALLAAGNVAVDYADVNPYALAPATAPHLAAAMAGTTIEIDRLVACYRRLSARADAVVVEGVGGWLVPIGAATTMADFIQRLDLPVVLVVGLKLGAINHAMLTADSIRRHGCRLAAWVANHPAGPAPDGYLDALAERLMAPCLGVIPPNTTVEDAVKCFADGMETVIAGKPES